MLRESGGGKPEGVAKWANFARSAPQAPEVIGAETCLDGAGSPLVHKSAPPRNASVIGEPAIRENGPSQLHPPLRLPPLHFPISARTIACISRATAVPCFSSPDTTPSRSCISRFWLVFHFPSMRVIGISIPTIPSSIPSI